MNGIPDRIKLILWEVFSDGFWCAGNMIANAEMCEDFTLWLAARMAEPMESYEKETLTWIGNMVVFCDGCGGFVGEQPPDIGEFAKGLCQDCLDAHSNMLAAITDVLQPTHGDE